VAGSSHFMEEEQAPPPPPPHEKGQDWGARFSTEIFGYNQCHQGGAAIWTARTGSTVMIISQES
jgi:hypothetical protein